MNNNYNFIPLLFAGDINVYSVARAFHEQYNMKPYVYGKYMSWPCAGSKIMNYTANPKADVSEVFLGLVVDFANKNQDKKVILIGCGDSYVQLIGENKDKLPENVIAPYINIDMMNRLIHKEKFYEICEQAGVDYPHTFVHKKNMGTEFELPFNAPFIIKPSNGIEYWRNPFPGQNKVFKFDTRSELDEVLKKIYDAGYDDSVIIQDFIPGDDSYMRVITNYSDKNGKVRMMCLGHVLLEEHTPQGIGNHAVIITVHNAELEGKIKALLDGLNYIGFSNFDIKYDRRDGKFKVFEINTRQGRSNFYVTFAGENIARYLVEDYIDDNTGNVDCKVVTKESLWLVLPKKVAIDYVASKEYKAQLKRLFNEGNYVNPLNYKHENGLKWKLGFLKNQLGHFVKYKKYLGKPVSDKQTDKN
jgi:D-aspartate ligase